MLKIALIVAGITIFAFGTYTTIVLQEIADGTRAPWQYGATSYMQLTVFAMSIVAASASLWAWTLTVFAGMIREVRRRRFQRVGMYHMPVIQHASAQPDKPPALSEADDGVRQGNE